MSENKELARCFVETYAEKEALKSKLQQALEQNKRLIEQNLELQKLLIEKGK